MNKLIIATTLLALTLSAGVASLPGDIPVDPRKILAGQSACIFPVHFTREGNIWLSPNSVYRRSDGQSCILTLRRITGKWIIETSGIPLRASTTRDGELATFGWLKLGSAREVLK